MVFKMQNREFFIKLVFKRKLLHEVFLNIFKGKNPKADLESRNQ